MKIAKKAVRIILVIGIVFILIIAGINLYIILVGQKNFTAAELVSGGFDCVIVPGAKVSSDGTVSYMLRDRLDFACELYEQGAAGKILVSGDHGETNYDEVNAMREYLVEKGVKTEDVFMDHAGFDTYSTMYRAREIFEVQSAVVCTQEYHLYRACYIAERLGIDIKGIPSDVYVSSKLPYFRLREWAARVKAFFEVELLHPVPVLGEKIPITGDGRITEDGKT